MKKVCRICKAPLSEKLLELKNVPAAAQFMPSTQMELAADKPVDLALYCCSGCGVVQHDLAPVNYFKEVIRASGVSAEMRKFRLEQFSSFLAKYGLAGKDIFEAGCGKGEYLEIMQHAGASVTGYEYSDTNVQACHAKKLSAVRGYFENGDEKISNKLYDGFFILNYLEHIPDIPAFLRGVRNNLKEGAAGIVEVPNFDMIQKNCLITEFSTEHICYFTEQSLKNTLELNGFDVKNICCVWHNYIISAEVIKRPDPDLRGFAGRGEKITADIKHFISRHRKTIWWGAGHQALTTLALANLSEKEICFVVDSSPDKQGHFTFVTHIPIVSPEELSKTDADAVIISCGGYSDEVANTVKEKFKNKFDVAILREDGVELL